MSKRNPFVEKIPLTVGVLVMSFLVIYLAYAWTDPSENPPLGNVPAPLNVGPQGQAKEAGLLLNTSRAPFGLIVHDGIVNLGTPAGEGDYPNQYIYQGHLGSYDKSQALAVEDSLWVTRNLFIDNDASIEEDLFVGHNAYIDGALSVEDNVSARADLFVDYDAYVDGALSVGEDLSVVGNVEAEAFYYSSDKRLKENITPLEENLSKILKLNGVSYNLKESNDDRIGLLAQEVKEIFPEIVREDQEGMLSIDSSGLIATLIEAVKEQQSEIEELKEEIEEIKRIIGSKK